jgi:hypothetical protein
MGMSMSICGPSAAARGTCCRRARLRASFVHRSKPRTALCLRRPEYEPASKQELRERPSSKASRAVDGCSLRALRRRGLSDRL